jgi:N-acetylglucosamine-6-phosphate deacetylase
MKTAITNTTLVMPDHLVPKATVIIEDGKIVNFGTKISADVCKVIDAKGAYTGPGLIDIHTHAGGGDLFTKNPKAASKLLLSHGVTTVLPALYFSSNREELINEAKIIKDALESGECDNIYGLYLEGPYMNPEFGANKEACPWKGDIKKEDYLPLLEALKGFVKVYVLAPERENILDFVKDAKALDSNVRFSVGHSKAEPKDIEACIPYGLCLATHHTNATGKLEIYPECRTACVDETALYNDTIYTELICDKIGIHVSPYILRYVKNVKGDDKIILISDAYVDYGPIPEGDLYEGAIDINFDHSGEISGSKITLDNACRNMMVHTGASLCQVFKYASRNPAKVLGLSDRGEIRIGNRADLILVDAEFNLKSVIINGKLV